MTQYLSAQEVLYVHQRVIARTGGAAGQRDVSLLKNMLNRPRATANGAEVYPTLPLKAAVLTYSLVQNYLFMDGNKRIGLQCLDLFLRVNGMRLNADREARYQFIVDVAGEALTIEQMAAWIESHLEAAAPPPPTPRPKRAGTRTTRRITISGPDLSSFTEPDQG